MAKEMDPEKLKVGRNEGLIFGCLKTGNSWLIDNQIINGAWHSTITHHTALLSCNPQANIMATNLFGSVFLVKDFILIND